MKISIIHPTRNREKLSFATYAKWLSNADNEVEYILSVDIDDPIPYESFFGQSIILRNPNKSAIEAINNASKIATGDLMIVVSDDFDCPKHWDTLLLNALQGKSDFCVKTNDGLQPTLITMPIMDRIYYERYGYIYHPDYSHMFCDQELTAVAIMTGKYIKLPLTFNHLHYSAGLSHKDAINLKNDSTWHQGETLFNERLKSNFGIENPVVPYESILWR